MQISKFVLALFIGAAAMDLAYGQGMTPAEQKSALDLLHKKMAEDRGKTVAPAPPAAAPAAPLDPHQEVERLRKQRAAESQKGTAAGRVATPAAPAPPSRSSEFMPPKPAETKMDSTPAKAVAEPGSAPPRTLADAWRKMFSRGDGASAKTPAKAAAAAPPAKPGPKAATRIDSASPTAKKVEAASVPPAPPVAVPTGPRTKEQRLADLLDLYKADKIGPTDYHLQRAKILTEP